MTKEEAIKELKILKEDYWDDDGYGHETKQYDDTMLALDMAIKALEQEPRWISVEEDTPPIGTICLWCNKQGSVFTSEITDQSEYDSRVGKHGYFSNGLENHGNIVAWMPLPKAYSEVEE